MLTGCGPQPKGFELITPGGRPFYLAHNYGFDRERTHSELADRSPAGLVLVVTLDGKMGEPVSGARSLDDLRPTLEAHPDMLPILSLYLTPNTLRAICGGGEEIARRLAPLEEWIAGTDRPVALSIGFQVDSPIWETDPGVFREGYRCLVDRFGARGLGEVSFGVHYSGMGPTYGDRPVADWFPGREYVNWLGVTAYKIVAEHFRDTTTFSRSTLEEVTDLAEQEDLGILILEANPRPVARMLEGGGDTLWDAYYEPLLQLLEDNESILGVAHHSGAPADSLATERYHRFLGGEGLRNGRMY